MYGYALVIARVAERLTGHKLIGADGHFQPASRYITERRPDIYSASHVYYQLVDLINVRL